MASINTGINSKYRELDVRKSGRIRLTYGQARTRLSVLVNKLYIGKIIQQSSLVPI